jgi:hypothetical protein
MAVNKVETVDIIRDLVTLLVTELTGSSAWVDNSNGTFTMPICKTYWLKAQDTITIDSVEYEVTDVNRDTDVTVKATSVPNGLSFYLDAPSFYHGTIIQTNQELSQDNKDVSERSPMAYLLRDLEETFYSDDNVLDRTTSIRLFFLHDTNFQDYTTELADEETLEPMRSMAYFFVEEVLKKSSQIARFDDYVIRDYLRFGRENASGYTENIFNDNFSGVELSITLPIYQRYLCACDELKAQIKYIDSDGTLKSVPFGTTPVCTPAGSTEVNVSNSDGSYNVDTDVDLVLPDVNVNVNASSAGTAPSVKNIEVNTVNQTPDSVGLVGSTLTLTMPTFTEKHSGELYKSGAQTSFRTGDDGDTEYGNGSTFYDLGYDNGFGGGNTARFTDFSGNDWNGVSATGNLAIDWATWDRVNDTVLVHNLVQINSQTWTQAVDWGLVDNLSTGYTDGWHLLNTVECTSITDQELGTAPTFFGSNGGDYWTSTTVNSTQAIYCRAGRYQQVRAMTSSEPARQARRYTLTEIGI